MLILPLHHRVEARRLPWMSLLIALACVFIHFGPQQGDHARRERADAQYADAGLGALEAPLYVAYAASHPDALVHAVDADVRSAEDVPPELLKADRGFRVALARGQGFRDSAAHAEWRQRSAAYRQAMAALVDERFAMPSDAPTTRQALSSAFLHGDAGHLFGNLLFLLMLGLLVERALGPWLHLALYLLSGVAAAWFWALTHSGPPTYVLGASGAVAGLMGALCVLWGMRRIRFFYWFFVIFDYVRAPALVLLPAWLGWELLQWALDERSNVAYQAHAGGIVAGALLALGVKALRGDRREAYDEPIDEVEDASSALADAQSALGRLDFSAVDRALEPLLAQMPVPVDARLLALRAAQVGARVPLAAAHASALLRETRAADRAKVLDALAAWRERGGRWAPNDALAHAEMLLAVGYVVDAGAVLSETAAAADSFAALPVEWAGRWLRLAFDLRRDGDEAAARRLFEALSRALPGTPEALKADAQLG
ncbi:MAG: rhomboid family intramembrane serine protease [Silanimonas sp.]